MPCSGLINSRERIQDKGELSHQLDDIHEQPTHAKQQRYTTKEQMDDLGIAVFIAIGDAMVCDETRDDHENPIKHDASSWIFQLFIQ